MNLVNLINNGSIRIQDVNEDITSKSRQLLREILIKIINNKLVHDQSLYHWPKAMELDNISANHCKTSHCFFGHFEIALLEQAAIKGGYSFYKTEYRPEVAWNGKQDQSWSPIIQNFIDTNLDDFERIYEEDSDVLVEEPIYWFVVALTKIYTSSAFKLVDGKIRIEELVERWNEAVEENGWGNGLLVDWDKKF